MLPEIRALGALLRVNSRLQASFGLVLGEMAWIALGCSARPGEGRTLGADLGTFTVDAELVVDECGPDALDQPRQFTFDVELARADTELFWDGAGGRLGADLDFEIGASVRRELRAPRGADAGCSIVRDDHIGGVLATDDTGAITSLTGEMQFAFDATPESTCTLEERESADLPRLPCRLHYALTGRRSRAPTP